MRSFAASLCPRVGPKITRLLQIMAGKPAVTGLALAWAPALVYILAFAGIARLLSFLCDADLVARLLAAAPGDDVHALLALEMAGDLGTGRLVLWPHSATLLPIFLGDQPLFSALPAFFAVAFPGGSSAVGIHITLLMVNFLFVTLGTVLLAVAHRRRSATALSRPARRDVLGWLGLWLFGIGAGCQTLTSWEPGTGGEMILTMVATKILDVHGNAYSTLDSLTGVGLSIGFNVVWLAIAVIAGGLLGMLIPTGAHRRTGMLELRWSHARAGLTAAGLAVALFHTPLRPAIAIERADPRPTELEPAVVLTPLSGSLPNEPSRASIESGPLGYEYAVNGSGQEIRCIGYNPITDGENEAVRAARYERDFGMLRAAHVNTILGWNQELFDDEVLLKSAAKHGLGVIPHFNFDPRANYEDPALFAQISQAAVGWVQRLKSKPSLRMWGLGNEVLHKYGGPNDPRASVFASFLVQIADLVHRLDPHHPVIYRDAEDVFLPPVLSALRADGVARPWFVYGMNFYSYRLDSALGDGPSRSSGLPLLVSEFAPLGLAPADRPDGYRKLWEMVQTHRDRVLGGCAYVWNAAGPEPVDRTLGLTDDSGIPVDESLATLASAFGRGSTGQITARSRGAQSPLP